jgi:hypothetical protein
VDTRGRPCLTERLPAERISHQDQARHQGQRPAHQPGAESGCLIPGGQLDQAPAEPQRSDELRAQLDDPEGRRPEAGGESRGLRRQGDRQAEGPDRPHDEERTWFTDAAPGE